MFQTWSIKTRTSNTITSFYIREDNSIFAFFWDSLTVLMKSVDGGETWEEKHLPKKRLYGNIFFTPSNIGFLSSPISTIALVDHPAVLYKSVDDGENWFLDKMNSVFSDVYFTDENRGYIAGGQRLTAHFTTGYLFYTANGGQSWDWRDFDVFPGKPRVALTFPTQDVGFMVHDDGIIYKSIDGGDNWEETYVNFYDSTGYTFSGTDISFYDEQIIYGVGRGAWSDGQSGAAILATYNGGETWDLVWNTTEHYSLYSSYTINNKTWAVGEEGLIVKSIQLDSFEVINADTDLPLNDVFLSDNHHGWISGGFSNYRTSEFQSILLRTSDGGEAWQQSQLSEYMINDMYFEDSLHGWAVGYDSSNFDTRHQGHGFIIITLDGGENWSPVIEGLAAPLKAIHFKNGIGWAVGDNGLILRTDNWVTWTDPNTGEVYPSQFTLHQNYPNPFNPITNFEFQITNSEFVNLSIYNLLGQKVATLVDKKLPAGSYTVQWDATGISSGVYIYTLETGTGLKKSRKLVLLK
jgi:photosystem II stability/assembly factor-like uncharacterized protein